MGRRQNPQAEKLADAPDCIGESWELTGVPGQESVVSNGEYAGRDIKSLLGEFGAQVVGLNTYNKYGDMFPIMVKFIDAAKDLSIQVHPDDDFASAAIREWQDGVVVYCQCGRQCNTLFRILA